MFKRVVTAIVIIAAFFTLLSLGFWQKQRLAWKEAMLADIARFESTNPAQIILDLSADYDGQEYRRGRIDGQFVADATPIILGPRTLDAENGYHVFMPFKTNDGLYILVNRGWIPVAMKDMPTDLSLPQSTWLAGHLRQSKRPSMTPNNNAETGFWYWPDMAAMQAFYNLDDVYPALFYVETAQNMPDGYPVAFDGLPKPRNKHAQYMTFWFGMAGMLLVLCGFAVFRRK